MLRFFFAAIAGGAVGRWAYVTGCEVASWSDADQIDYVFLPLLACVLPYTIAVSVILAAVGGGWMRSANTTTTNKTKEG